jgi:hypothetical protein
MGFVIDTSAAILIGPADEAHFRTVPDLRVEVLGG